MAKSDVAAHNLRRPFDFISFKQVTEPGNVNRKLYCKQVGFYTLLKCVTQLLQHACIFISNEMTREKCFKTMAPLDLSRDVTC